MELCKLCSVGLEKFCISYTQLNMTLVIYFYECNIKLINNIKVKEKPAKKRLGVSTQQKTKTTTKKLFST